MRQLFLLCFLLLSSYTYLHSQKKTNSKELNILFIGNSLTYSNNLPELVTKEAKQKGMIVHTKMVAYPNYAIEDHWNNGQVQKLIASKKFDLVILQQGPSSQSDGRKMLIEYGKKYQKLCKENNTQLGYFMVWPAQLYYYTFNGVIKNYTDAAKLNNAILFPVGKVWKKHFTTTNDYSYYSQDKFHPSLEGSQSAAKIIVDVLSAKF
ncbi:SGNH/GDSL hydrolase family protein [Tenacibaculum amylolyticum]|uniref:SGNH/GDSL hydrolase family protein n=1 Tax=Tenacibaculum amylolyticum TaxID=104269 RepID=UPI003895CDE8